MPANIQSITVDKRKKVSLQPALTSLDAFDFLPRWGVSNQANNIPATTSTTAKKKLVDIRIHGIGRRCS